MPTTAASSGLSVTSRAADSPVAASSPVAAEPTPTGAGEPRLRQKVRKVSVVIPAYNEAGAIARTLEQVRNAVAEHKNALYEVIVVNDGSSDDTRAVAERAGVRVVNHPYNIGNGAAVKSGIRAARGDIIVCMDGDGQHRPEYIPQMVDLLEDYHIVVGARRREGQASFGRAVANAVYNGFATYITHFRIRDLTSGFRAMRAESVRRYLYLLPNTFSYPTTTTLSMLRAGLSLRYLDMATDRRSGRSKIRPIRDGVRFLMIMIKIATLFAPLRIFLPVAGVIFSLGLGYYIYTFVAFHRFTNMGMLLIVLSFLMFSLGLISEQIAQLRYDRSED